MAVRWPPKPFIIREKYIGRKTFIRSVKVTHPTGTSIAVNKCIVTLCREFHDTPTLFYTENDLVCRLHALLEVEIGRKVVLDKDKSPHLLLHTEYPTPFLCTGGRKDFRILPDGTRGARRGNYDLAILNPDVIREFSYEYVKSQDYSPHGKALKKWAEKNGPVIDFGIELSYKRNAMSYSRQADRTGTAEKRAMKIVRDAKKLQAAIDVGFMREGRAILFVRRCGQSALERIKSLTVDYPSVIVQPSIQCGQMENMKGFGAFSRKCHN